MSQSECFELVGKSADPGSFLHQADGKGWADPVGMEVVIFLPGYEEQLKELKVERAALRWTGHEQMAESTTEGVVAGCSYFVRGPFGGEGVQETPAGGPNAIDQAPGGAQTTSDQRERGAGDGAGSRTAQAQPFVRLQLQRKSEHSDSADCFIDYFLNGPVGEFVIKKDRFVQALGENFKRDDRVSMFWKDASHPEGGEAFTGTVLSAAVKQPGAPSGPQLRGTGWESVDVMWNATGESSRVNVWELARVAGDAANAPAPAGRPRRVSAPRKYSDYEYDLGYDDDEYNPSTSSGKRARLNNANLPQTMVKGMTKLVWNDNLCHVCKLPDNLIQCAGQCLRSFHAGCIPEGDAPPSSEEVAWYCKDCKEGNAVCTICKETGLAGVDVHKCKMGSCGSFYHLDCLKGLPSWSVGWGTKNDRSPGAAERHLDQVKRGLQKAVFVCPGHFCHECHLSGDALRTLRCSNCNLHAYHVNHVRWDHCLKVASDKNLLCPFCSYKSFHPEGASAMPDLLTYTPTFEVGKTLGRVSKFKGAQTHSPLMLAGKKRFLFGSHTKGGGCDFIMNLKGVKFHTEITAESPGKYVIKSSAFHANKPGGLPLLLNGLVLGANVEKCLKHGDVFEIASHKFLFEVVPVDHAMAEANAHVIRFPDEISLERPKAAPSHAEGQEQMDKLLEAFDVANYNVAFSKLNKSEQKRMERAKPKEFIVDPVNRSKRDRKKVKLSDMWYSDEDSDGDIIMEPEPRRLARRDQDALATNPILPPDLAPGKEDSEMEIPDLEYPAEQQEEQEGILGALDVLQTGGRETSEQHTQTELTFSGNLPLLSKVMAMAGEEGAADLAASALAVKTEGGEIKKVKVEVLGGAGQDAGGGQRPEEAAGRCDASSETFSAQLVVMQKEFGAVLGHPGTMQELSQKMGTLSDSDKSSLLYKLALHFWLNCLPLGSGGSL